MKRIIRKVLQKLYFFAFPSGMPIYGDRVPNCILGQGSRLYGQAAIHNGSKCKENITIGNNTLIAGNLTVWANAGKIEVGDWCFVGENSRIYSAKHIKIGNRVQIAHDCNVFDSNIHSLDPIERHKEYIQNTTNGLVKLFSMEEQEVIIEDDAWLGGGVVVLKGVIIGKGAIVGAGSVVTKDVPDYAMVVGNPARVVRILEFDRPGTKPEGVATEGSGMHS